MTTKRMELCPGVWLTTVQTNRFKTGSFSFNILRPLAEETASVNALIPSVLLRGCKAYPDIQSISRRLDELYGASVGTIVKKKGEVQTFGLYADFLEDCYADNDSVFAQMMEFVSDLLFDPCVENGGFVEEYVYGEKQNLLNTIASRINDKRSYAITRILKHMCAGEAYRVTRLGEKEALEGVSPVTLYAAWQEALACSTIEIFYLGQKSQQEVFSQMKCFIERLPGRTISHKPETRIIMPERDVQVVEETLDITQGKLCIGFRTPVTVQDPRYPALMVLNTIYGAGMTSKLFTKIREEQSLCYYASSSVDRIKGIMVVGSGIEFENYEIARDGILEQLDLCRRGQISDDEMESAVSYLISSLRVCNDNPGQMDDFMIGQSVAGIDGTVSELIEDISKVTIFDVVDVANTITLDTIYFLKGVSA